MRRSSALEEWFHELLARARHDFSTHDRFVLVTVALSVTPMPFPALLAPCLGLIQLHLIRTGRLDRRERSLLRIAILLGLLNLAVWFTVGAVLIRGGFVRNAISFLRDAHLYPLFWLGRLLGKGHEPPAWILLYTTLSQIGLARGRAPALPGATDTSSLNRRGVAIDSDAGLSGRGPAPARLSHAVESGRAPDH